MPTNLDRRLARLENGTATALPWHLPPEYWTDAQLCAVALPGRKLATVTDDDLRAVIAEISTLAR
jgi:hypothetical protein